jgi:hypothetical protein
MPLGCFSCPNCDSPHFLVRWGLPDSAIQYWTICCEGCGAVYRLDPNGVAEVLMKGIEQA